MTLLDVTDLSVASTAGRRAVQSVRPLTFTLSPGETLGLLGQPGSGSSVIAQAIAGVATGAAVTGSVVFDGRDLLTMSERDLAKLREVDIALLSPAVGASAPAAARKGRTRSLPQQPKLLIVDVGADAVDHELSRFIMRLQAEAKTAVVLVTEDLGSLADLTDLVIEMYAGKAVEFADGRTLTYRAHHPYTLSLVTSQPTSASPLDAATSGCPYHPRCPYVMERCVVEEPPPLLVQPAGRHRSACWLPLDLLGVGADVDRRREEAAQAGRNAPATPAVVEDATPAAQPSSSQPSSEPSPQPAEALVASTTAVRPRKAGRPAPPARPRSRTVPNEARRTDAPAPAKTAPAKKAAAKKAAAKKAPVKKTAVTKAPAKKAAVKTAGATKAPAKSARAAKAPGKKTEQPPAE